MLIEYKGKQPVIGKDVFIAWNATIIGDVKIADGASIWYGAVIRGDMAPITIGKNSNVQDNCTVHTDHATPVTIGDNVTVGHNAVIHGCTLEDRCLIGINATILNRSVVKTGSIVAAGSVVREGQVVGPYALVAGVPAEVKRELDAGVDGMLEASTGDYVELADGQGEADFS